MNTRFLPFVLAVFAAPALFAQDYQVLIERPLKVGDQLKLSVTGKQSQSQSVTVNGTPQKNDKLEQSVEFEGVEKVLAVDANGKETKITLTVDKFAVTSDGETKEAAPKGTVITCSMGTGKEQIYEIDGKVVGADATAGQALDMIVDLSRGGPSDDDAFGTKEKKKKGDSWDVNADQLKKYLDGMGELTNVAGKTTLEDVSGGSMKIGIHFTADFKPPLPEGFTMDSAGVDGKVSGAFPLDATKYETEDSSDISSTFSGHEETQNGNKIIIQATTSQSSSRTVTPVK